MRIPASIVNLITVKSKILKNADSRSIVEECLKTFQDSSCKWRLLNIAVIVRIWIKDKSSTKIEKQ